MPLSPLGKKRQELELCLPSVNFIFLESVNVKANFLAVDTFCKVFASSYKMSLVLEEPCNIILNLT